MHYRNYKGPKLSFEQLSADLQQVAMASFIEIHARYFQGEPAKCGSLHQRINSRFWQKHYRSRALVRRIATDRKYALASFDSNLTEFTESGEYLNLYLEPI